MTFQEFQATGRDCDDLGLALRIESLTGIPGRLYGEALYIEDTYDDHQPYTPTADEALAMNSGRWHLQVGREELFSDDLSRLEQKLYDWAAP